ncbi:MAG: hypothetical protein IT204_19340 [Fimbriimonadaceae bacterium]|nr:hypothetical protein [Fimbriimonadaceae bacterium]
MNRWQRRWAERHLAAYYAGRLSSRQRRRLAGWLEADPELQALAQWHTQLGALLRTQDPAAPPDSAAQLALQARLRQELRPLAVARLWRPSVAAAAALALFAGGCLTGAAAFPRQVERAVVQTVVKEVPVERRVVVEKPVKVIQKVPVTVRVPVEKVVTRWRTRTLVRTQVVYRSRGDRGRGAPARAAVPVVQVRSSESHQALAALPGGERPAAVDF